MEAHRVFLISFANVYPHGIQKVEKKGRTKQEVDELAKLLTMEKILRPQVDHPGARSSGSCDRRHP